MLTYAERKLKPRNYPKKVSKRFKLPREKGASKVSPKY